MNEREYVKVNTSIQTGSNAHDLLHDDEGNIEASIELRLPDNLFDTNSGTREITQVDLKTSKMRLSMMETPIAKIPIDTDLSNPSAGRVISTMQLDVYPFCMLDDGSFYPSPSRTDLVAAPTYKNKAITIYIRDVASTAVLKSWNGYANDLYNPLPDDVITTFLDKAGVGIMHLMSICVQGNHEKLNFVNSGQDLYLRNIGSLEQCLQDAIENAIMYAYTSSSTEIVVLVSATTDEDPEGVEIEGHGYYKYNDHFVNRTTNCTLKNEVKPIVKIDQQSLSISFDSAAFDGRVPIIWSPANVDTNDYPVQLKLDDFRKRAWTQPPAKRPYNYPIIWNADNSWGYAIPTDNTMCAPINIIVNKEMRDVFSFLPWIPMDIPISPTPPSREIHGTSVTTQRTVNYMTVPELTGGHVRALAKGTATSHSHSFKVHSITGGYSSSSPWGTHYAQYTFDVDTGKSPDNPDNRKNQAVDFGNITVSSNVSTFNNGPVIVFDKAVRVTDDIVSQTDPEVIFTDNLENPETYTDGQVIAESYSTVLSGTVNGDNLPTGVNYSLTSGQVIYVSSPFDATPGACRFLGHDIGGTWADGAVPNAPSPMLEDYVFVSKTEGEGVTSYVYRYNYRYIYQLLTVYDETPITYVTVPVQAIYSRLLTTQTAHITYSTTDAPSSESMIPNLLSTEYFLLDGTPAVVSTSSPELMFNSSAVAKRVTTTTRTLEKQVHTGQVKGVHTYTTPTCVDVDGFGWSTIVQVAKTSLYDAAVGVPCELVVSFTYDSTLYTWEQVIAEQAPVSTVACSLHPTGIITTDSVTIVFESGVVYPRNTTDRTLVTDTDTVTEEELFYDTSLVPPDSSTSESQTKNTGYWATQTGAASTLPTHVVGGYLLQPDLSAANGRYDIDNLYWLQPTSSYYPSGVGGSAWRGGIPRIDFSSDDMRKFCSVSTEGSNTTYTFIFATCKSTNNGYSGLPVYSSGLFTANGRSHGSVTATADGIPYNVYRAQDKTTVATSSTSTNISKSVIGNTRITFTWNNLPTVVLSPIQSIVLTLEGIHVSQEYQPVNIAEPSGSSLTSTIPVIENYYSLAASLRDLHDELIVTKDEFDDTATYKVSLTGGQQRSLRLSAKFIDKDGSLQQIYIPPNGVFTLQLTFGLSYYVSSGI